MLRISNQLAIPLDEIEMHAIRAQGAGGQHVNKVATAIHLRFDIQASTLPPHIKEKLMAFKDHRISKEGVVVIKSQSHRSQDKNREEALGRLRELVAKVMVPRKKRKATRPSRSSKQRRIDRKVKRGRIKTLRGKVNIE